MNRSRLWWCAQNITLSEDVHRLSSQVEAHMRFHSRAEAATTSWEQKHAQAQDEVAALKGENDALAQVRSLCGGDGAAGGQQHVPHTC